jgi:hypothetical protein
MPLVSHTSRPSSAEPSAAQASASRAQAERAAQRLSQAEALVDTARPPRLPSTANATDGESWFHQLRRRISEEWTAYSVSVLVHLVILAIFAIPVIRHVTQDEPLIAGIVEDAAGGGSSFGLPEMINTELVPARPLANTPAQLAVPDFAAENTLAVSKALLGTPDGDGGEGTGSGAGIGAGEVGNGMMQFVPKNAVRKGSFAAWTTPVFDDYFPRPFGAPDPEPGVSPRPMQNYWITIQIKVPGNRRRYSVRDLTGEVIGTDGYRQKIPEHTFRLSADGKLLPLQDDGQVPVVDGFVQLVVKVPGARSLVKDTIVVKSKSLKEEQALEIVFKGDRDRDVEEEL